MKKPRLNKRDRRLWLIQGLLLLWVGFMGWRLVRLQVNDHDWLQSKAERQQQAGKATFLPLPAPEQAQVAPLPRSVMSPALGPGEELEPLLWHLPALETASGEGRPASGPV